MRALQDLRLAKRPRGWLYAAPAVTGDLDDDDWGVPDESWDDEDEGPPPGSFDPRWREDFGADFDEDEPEPAPGDFWPDDPGNTSAWKSRRGRPGLDPRPACHT